jgi:pilus assembly protein FimV
MSLRPALSAALLVPCLAAAAELGRLTVLSGVGQPLRAEIEIVAVRPGEAAGLGARIPPPDVFWRANLEPAPVLDELRVGVERRAQGRYVIAIRSSGPIADPFMQLLVELTSPAGSVVREYPFLLEEPRARRPGVAAAPLPLQPELPVGEVSPPVVPPGDGYDVKPGDTLAVIAETVRPRGVTLEQMIVALYQANEQAFVDRNMNRLRARETLAVPAEDAARAVEPTAARSIILEHRAAFDEYRRRLAGAAAVAPAAEAPPGGTGAAATSSRGAGDRLRLSRGDERKPGAAVATTAREDDLAALHHALGETKERIAALEKNVGDVTTLLTLKNRELARLERDARATGQTLVSLSGDPMGAGDSPEPSGRSALVRLLDEYGAWLMVALLLFVSWILMPFKTLRLWLKKRRHQARKARRAAERVRRAARDAGLLPWASSA